MNGLVESTEALEQPTPAATADIDEVFTASYVSNPAPAQNLDPAPHKVTKQILKEAMERQSNLVITPRNEIVATSCGICHSNSRQHDASTPVGTNPFLNLDGLRHHYAISHRDECDVKGKSLDDEFDMCSKVVVAPADVERIARGESPLGEGLASTKGYGVFRLMPLICFRVSTDLTRTDKRKRKGHDGRDGRLVRRKTFTSRTDHAQNADEGDGGQQRGSSPETEDGAVGPKMDRPRRSCSNMSFVGIDDYDED